MSNWRNRSSYEPSEVSPESEANARNHAPTTSVGVNRMADSRKKMFESRAGRFSSSRTASDIGASNWRRLARKSRQDSLRDGDAAREGAVRQLRRRALPVRVEAVAERPHMLSLSPRLSPVSHGRIDTRARAGLGPGRATAAAVVTAARATSPMGKKRRAVASSSRAFEVVEEGVVPPLPPFTSSPPRSRTPPPPTPTTPPPSARASPALLPGTARRTVDGTSPPSSELPSPTASPPSPPPKNPSGEARCASAARSDDRTTAPPPASPSPSCSEPRRARR